jgi:REP element-mobilizing transposase RayT
VRSGLPSLRNHRFIGEFRVSLREACERCDFRVCQYSIQRDHLQMLVEATGKEALARGMKAVAARLARAVNRVFRRKGVLFGRYHLRALKTPREVRNALAYVVSPHSLSVSLQGSCWVRCLPISSVPSGCR